MSYPACHRSEAGFVTDVAPDDACPLGGVEAHDVVPSSVSCALMAAPIPRAAPVTTARRVRSVMARNLVLSGGVGHPFASTSQMLADVLAPHGIGTVVAAPEQWEDAIAAHVPGDGLLTFNALRWRMLADRYDALRAAESYASTPALHRAVEDHLAAGGALLSLHTSCICFDDWPGWAEILGAAWDWDRSFHPVRGDVHVHDLVHDTRFTVNDELYHGLGVSDPAREVLAVASVPRDSFVQNTAPVGASGVGDVHPVLWRRRHGRGRVVVDTLGHDHLSLGHPAHRRALGAAIEWAVAGV